MAVIYVGVKVGRARMDTRGMGNLSVLKKGQREFQSVPGDRKGALNK